MRSLTYRERLFVDYYLGESSESAVDAARRAWYPSPEELGPRLLKKSAVQAAIAAGAGTAAITPNEVLARYADIAASDMRDFMAVDKNGGLKVDLKLSQRRDLGHLIKRVRIHKDGSQDIELEPRLPALAKLGEYFLTVTDFGGVAVFAGFHKAPRFPCRSRNSLWPSKLSAPIFR
jgi:hypothetical protein